MAKSPSKPKDIELEPDAWDRFKRAVRTIGNAKPKHREGRKRSRASAFVPDASAALAEWDEVARLAASNNDLLVYISRMIEEGAPLLCADVNGPTAKTADHRVIRYHLPDELAIRLAAARAR